MRMLLLTVGFACGVAAWGNSQTWAQPAQLDKAQDVFDALKRCFKPPVLDRDHPGMQITVHFALKRNGELLGKPRITFESQEANDDDRLKYRIAIMRALETCSPFPLSESLGGAIAGKPFRMLFNDRRNEKRPETKT